MDDVLPIKSSRVVQWMNIIRNCNKEIQYRILESFWDSQLRSKSWLINNIKKHIPTLSGNVYVIGGWYGILSQLIVDNFPTSVYNIDIDDSCIIYGNMLSNNDSRINFITEDMARFNNYIEPNLVINTSTEHVTQDVYDMWLKNIPVGTPVVIQGNNFYECQEHVRCFETLEEFNNNSTLKNIVFTNKLKCMGPNKPFYRFMTIGYK